MKLVVQNCYDSHVHWLKTGEMDSLLDLKDLKSPEEVGQIIIHPYFYRGDWIVGFGWDHSKWRCNEFPSTQLLDKFFPNNPVCFSRIDGHAIWVNSLALKRAGLYDIKPPAIEGGLILENATGKVGGVLLDKATHLIESLIPQQEEKNYKQHLLRGMKIFNRAGFTHIRDMTCSEQQFSISLELERNDLLSLAVEQFFDADEKNFDFTLNLIKRAQKEKSHLIRVKGIKVFFDGALGSEGALISQPYKSGSGNGMQTITNSGLKEIMIKTWSNDLELAVHVIGDEAVDRVLRIARLVQVERGISGTLHLEHIELMRPESLEFLKLLNVKCHLQPCHWLSDHRWLKDKIGKLSELAFPWATLEENHISFDFGSDSPIESSDLFTNLRAIDESSEQGVRPLTGEPLLYHVHRDQEWVPNTFSTFDGKKTKEVVFQNRRLSL